MSAIKDFERLGQRQLETVRRRQAREIANIENSHQDNKIELAKTHAEELVNLRDENERHVGQEAVKKEKVLEKMRGHLQETRNFTDKELKALKEQTQTVRAQEQTKLANEREKVVADNELHMDELKYRSDQQIKKVNNDKRNEIQKLTQTKDEEFSGKEAYYTDKIGRQSNEFNTRFQNDSIKNKQVKDLQDSNFKKERMTTNHKQQVEMAKMTDSHNMTVEKRDEEYRKGLKQQDEFFEKKYATTLKGHEDQFKRLNEKNEQVTAKLKDDLKEHIMTAVKRSDDPFYQFTQVNPRLTQFPDRVEIRVPVPDHAKEDVHLTTNGKEVIINFNRRYDDSQKTETGTLNKLHKVESYTTRLTTERILDPKSVKQTYDSGVMTYIVKNA